MRDSDVDQYGDLGIISFDFRESFDENKQRFDFYEELGILRCSHLYVQPRCYTAPCTGAF